MGYKVNCIFHKPFGDLASEEHACMYHGRDGIHSCDGCSHSLDADTAFTVLRRFVDTIADKVVSGPLFLDYIHGELYIYHYGETGLSVDTTILLSQDLLIDMLNGMLAVLSGSAPSRSIKAKKCTIVIASPGIDVLTISTDNPSSGLKTFSYKGYLSFKSMSNGIRAFIAEYKK